MNLVLIVVAAVAVIGILGAAMIIGAITAERFEDAQRRIGR
jgi:hypothetical protein